MSAELKSYKSGFVHGSGINTDEILLDERNKDPKVVKFLMYDATLMPAPDLSTWNPKYRDEIIKFMKRMVSGDPREIWVDDIKIKDYEKELMI